MRVLLERVDTILRSSIEQELVLIGNHYQVNIVGGTSIHAALLDV